MIEQELPTSHTFDIESVISVSDDLLNAIKLGISTVWNTNVNTPHQFRLVIGSYITDEHMVPTGELAYYNPDVDTFYFGVDTIRDKLKEGDLASNLFILAAHECYHLIQTLRGDRPIPSRSLSSSQYANNRHEQEAWNAAKRAVLQLYPNASGKLLLGDNKVVLDFDQAPIITESVSWKEKEKQFEPLATEVTQELSRLLPFSPDFYSLQVIPTANGVVVNLDTNDGDELKCDIYPKAQTNTGSIRIIFVRSKIKGRGSLFIRAINQVAKMVAECEVSRASTVVKASQGFWSNMGYTPESSSSMDWILRLS